jgi:hypothetical protein
LLIVTLSISCYANEGEIEGWLRTRSKQEIARLGEIEARLARDRSKTFYLCLLLCIFLSTKGAYYGANKQALLLSTFGA